MPILALTRYQRLGSSSRVRFYQYYPFLKSHGLKIINIPFFTDEYIHNLYNGRRVSTMRIAQAYLKRLAVLLKSKTFDILWVEKEFLPWFPPEIELFFHPRKVPYVVDYDDAVFHRYDKNSNPIIRFLLGHKIDRVMHNASTVIAGNDYLAERAKTAGAPRVEILPSVVDVNQYAIKKPDTDKVFKIGWIGSPVTVQYLDLVHDAVSKFNHESPVQMVLVGAGNVAPFPDIPTKMLPWSESLELTVNQNFDVGIMPLVDSPFERGKCGYKLIQYMAGGIPIIASPVGVNQQIVEQGVNGYLANSPNEWLTALRTLRDNLQTRIKMGNAGRHKAEKLYNLQMTAPKLMDILKRAANK